MGWQCLNNTGWDSVYDRRNWPLTIRADIQDEPHRTTKSMLRYLQFDIKFVYKPEIKIPVADALFRVCMTTAKLHHVNVIPESPIDLQIIKQATAQDPKLDIRKDVI